MYYVAPAVFLVSLAYLVLPLDVFVVHVLSLATSFAAHVYLHIRYHLSDPLLKRFSWFQHALAVQPDGKIVAARSAFRSFALARYNADGSLDTTFGSGGKVTARLGGGVNLAKAVAAPTRPARTGEPSASGSAG